MRKKVLKKRHERMLARRESLRAKALASSDVNEVRSINEQIEDLNADIADVEEEIEAIEEEERQAQQNAATREDPPAAAPLQNAGVVESFRQAPAPEGRAAQPTESMEYRQAFMRFVQSGEMNAELRAGSAITSGDVAPAIPLTIMREVINTVRLRYGNLYSRVRKTNMQGGVEYPIGSLRATFKWVTESTVSPRQKLDPLAKVSFSYHTAEIRVAQSFVAALTVLEDFETKIAEVIAIAYLEAMDVGIVNGTGDGQMLGILNDPRVTGQAGHIIAMTEADMSDWSAWRKKFFAKLPLGYRNGEFIFPMSTVETYLETMADSNNQPIFRQATGLEVNDGDARDPNGRFFGRRISLVEPDVLPDFSTAEANTIVGIFWQPEEYAINENFGFTMRRYFDEETNEWVDKALAVVDGKVLNPAGIYLIKKSS